MGRQRERELWVFSSVNIASVRTRNVRTVILFEFGAFVLYVHVTSLSHAQCANVCVCVCAARVMCVRVRVRIMLLVWSADCSVRVLVVIHLAGRPSQCEKILCSV